MAKRWARCFSEYRSATRQCLGTAHLCLRTSLHYYLDCNHTPTHAIMIIRPTARPQCLQHACVQQVRHASLLRRPKRPYTFTQLVTLSDGSTFTHRTTSPTPVIRSTKDVRNSPLWNPSSQKLLNVEEDEAGRLARFRDRFGRGWDAESLLSGEEVREFSRIYCGV